jgi:cytochrome c553
MGARKNVAGSATAARQGSAAMADSGPEAGRAGQGAGRGDPRGAGAALAAVVLAFAAAGVEAQEVKGDPEAAKSKIGMCIGCHSIEGYRASYPSVYSVPKINGQTQRYIELALTAYRNGDRNHPTMRAIAGSLTDQDIADLAAYYGKAQEAK